MKLMIITNDDKNENKECIYKKDYYFAVRPVIFNHRSSKWSLRLKFYTNLLS